LAFGAESDEVTELQRNLRRLGYFKRTPTGYYGEITQAAVSAFQGDNRLPATGSVDDDTWDAIQRQASAVKGPDNQAYSEIEVDPQVQPRRHSTIPGYEDEVEQCGEFAFRYFRSQGKPYPTLGQPYNFLMTGKDEQGREKPQYQRVLNGSETPPKAGDILVAKGPRPGQFHTAIVTKVEGDKVHVLQANVPYNWQGSQEIEGTFPLRFEDGQYTMPDLPTSQKGYNNDYPVVGWIHPTGDDALPGAQD
jgi:peptidoglycan hydrolase-like protein with peptidoglycan-binding domain